MKLMEITRQNRAILVQPVKFGKTDAIRLLTAASGAKQIIKKLHSKPAQYPTFLLYSKLDMKQLQQTIISLAQGSVEAMSNAPFTLNKAHMSATSSIGSWVTSNP